MGSGADCPADGFLPGETPCRVAAEFCDQHEDCTGSSAVCPDDIFKLDGTLCVDGTVCNGEEQCQSGTCTAGAPLECDDGNVCTAESCDEITGCASVEIPNCNPVDVPSVTPPIQLLISLILLVAGGVYIAQRRQGMGV
jgi:hypothetical protein